MTDFSDAVKQRTAKEFLNSTKNLATWLTRRDVLTKQTINPDTLISWVRGYVNDLECDCKYYEEQNRKLKSQIDNNPTSTMQVLQEKISTLEKELTAWESCTENERRSYIENITRTFQPPCDEYEYDADEVNDRITELIDKYCQKDCDLKELQESNTRFEKQVSDLTAQVLQLQIENKQLKNVNTGLHLLIDEQDEKQKDRELIKHCQAVVDAANELRSYLEGE